MKGLVYASLGGDHPFDEDKPLEETRATAYSKNTPSLLLFRGLGFVTIKEEDADFPLLEDRAAGIPSKRTTMTMYNPQVFNPDCTLVERFNSLRLVDWGQENIRFPT